MTLMIGLVVLQVLILPPLFAFWLGAGKPLSKTHWFFLVVLVGTYLTTITLAGPWSWFHVNLAYVPPILFALAFLASLRRLKGLQTLPPGGLKSIFNLVVVFLVGALFTMQTVVAIGGRIVPEETVELAFPLEGGRFVVGQGGASPLLNYHNAYPTQTFALDILALHENGRRAHGLMPDALEKYAIYGARVVSPCDGTVVETDDGHIEHKPGLPNEPKFPAGNYAVIDCGKVTVLLAHMQPLSLAVQPGQLISTGDLIGLVGNSGNTSEPHLHIHAERSGTGKPILEGDAVALTFGGRFLLRNHVVEN